MKTVTMLIGVYGLATQFKIFGEGYAEENCLNPLFQNVREMVFSKSPDYILNVNEEQFVDHIVSALSADVPVIDFEGRTASNYEKLVSPDDFPGRYYRTNQSFRTNAIVFHYPISGKHDILKYRPLQGYGWSMDCYISNGDLCFDVLQDGRQPADVLHEWSREEGYIKTNYQNILREADAHMERVRQTASQYLKERRKQFLAQNDFMEQLGVPLKKSRSLPETFAIPSPAMRKKIVPAPDVTEKGYKPDPAILEKDYQDILRILHDAGKAMEQHPSTYSGKDEEGIRDLLLFQLSPHYEGSATAETFNKRGKTDIMLSHSGGIAFIAECKFWTGEGAFQDSENKESPISQLLKYLTWRNSKTALLLFVRNKDISRVIENVKLLIPEHGNFIKLDHTRDESWIEYRFHLNGDRNREMKMAVMIFHFPD